MAKTKTCQEIDSKTFKEVADRIFSETGIEFAKERSIDLKTCPIYTKITNRKDRVVVSLYVRHDNHKLTANVRAGRGLMLDPHDRSSADYCFFSKEVMVDLTGKRPTLTPKDVEKIKNNLAK